MHSGLNVTELLTTTRAFRRRLDPDRPVEPDLLAACLDIAVHAPSGSNRQPWRFVVVDDPQLRGRIAGYYRRAFDARFAGRTPRPDQRADLASGRYLADRLDRIPVLVIVCSAGRPGPAADAGALAGFYGSVYPLVWNLQLALHAHGLGSCLTTAHLAYEREVAELLGIPYPDVAQVALLPVAYLLPGRTRPGRRLGAAQLTDRNGWTPR